MNNTTTDYETLTKQYDEASEARVAHHRICQTCPFSCDLSSPYTCNIGRKLKIKERDSIRNLNRHVSAEFTSD